MKERTTVTMGVIEFDPDRPETRLATNFRIGIELESVGKTYPMAERALKGERIMDRGSCRPETSTSLVREFDLS